MIDIPQFLTKEIEMYVNRCYGLPDNERLFPIVAEAVQHKLKRACVKSGVKQIRVHDERDIIGTNQRKPSKIKGSQMI